MRRSLYMAAFSALAVASLPSMLQSQGTAVRRASPPPFWSSLSTNAKFNVFFAPTQTSRTAQGDMVAALRLTSTSPLAGSFPAIEEQAHVSVACSSARYTVHDHTSRANTGEIRLILPVANNAVLSQSSTDWIQQASIALCRSPLARARR